MQGVPYSLIELSSSEAVRTFGYKGKKVGMIEDEVKAALKSALERRGYEVIVRWGQKPGTDIEATVGGAKIVLEVKGEGSYRQMLGNNFLSVLGEIVLRMTDPTAEYGIGLPAHPSYIELVLKIPKRVRDALRLDFYFVRPGGYHLRSWRIQVVNRLKNEDCKPCASGTYSQALGAAGYEAGSASGFVLRGGMDHLDRSYSQRGRCL